MPTSKDTSSPTKGRSVTKRSALEVTNSEYRAFIKKASRVLSLPIDSSKFETR